MARILFVDDDYLTLELMERLAELLGHQAILCPAGAEAAALAARTGPDLILVDLSLADRDGLEVIRELHQLPATASIPVFVLSAVISPGVCEEAARAGGMGCLEKPLRPDTLEQLVKIHAMN